MKKKYLYIYILQDQLHTLKVTSKVVYSINCDYMLLKENIDTQFQRNQFIPNSDFPN